MSRRAGLLLVAAVVAMGVAGLLRATDALHGLELAAVEARFDVRGAQAPSRDVVIVGLDDRTLDATPGGMPLDRARHAAVVEQLTKAGAAVIAYGFQFTSESEDPDADNALVEAVRATPKIVLGTADVEPNGTTTIFGGGEALEYSGATPADTRFLDDEEGEDADGVRVRELPFSLSNLRSFSLAAVDEFRGRRTPTPAGERAWIDFAGAPGTWPVLSFGEVERGRFDAAAVRGKIVVVGATAQRANDFLATSTSGGGLMARPEVEAAAIATALRGFPLHEAAPWLNTLLALGLAIVGPLLALRFRVLFALAAGLAAIAGFLVAAQLTFNGGTILATVPPLAGALTGLVGAVLVSRPQESPGISRLLDRLSPAGGNQRARRIRAVLLLAAAGGVVTVTLAAAAGDVLRSADLSTVDYRFSIRGEQPAHPDVLVVALDDKTLTTDPKPTYPLPRDIYARAVRNLTAAGAAVIAMDVQFSEATVDEKADSQLVEALHDAPSVVLSATETDGAGETLLFSFGKGLGYTGGEPAITLVVKDADGRVRRMILSKQKLTSFALAAAEAKLERRIATPEGRTAWIDYAGPNGTIPYLSLVDVERNRFRPEAVRDKVVIIGATASSLQDRHNTSVTRNFLMPGPEIQANSVATALDGFPLHGAAWWVNVLLVIAVGASAPLVGLRGGVVAAVAAGLAAVGLFLLGAQVAFQRWDALVTVVYPVAAGIGGILLTAAIHGLTVAFEREQARDAFARFVPEAVVDQVLADAEGVRLGGVRGEATVMFSDLRGFTSFSETLEPERVIEALNRYLTEMSGAILDHGGTLVAYMGDGIMAVFGAPLKQDDHADRALEAARDMLARMDAFNGWLRERDLHGGFKMGIGLNSGPVMSGNVGSERRLEYTALGDTTNTAARLEGMTKGSPYQLYISDTTKQKLTRAPDDLIQVGEAEVRGRKAKVLLWSLRDGDGRRGRRSEAHRGVSVERPRHPAVVRRSTAGRWRVRPRAGWIRVDMSRFLVRAVAVATGTLLVAAGTSHAFNYVSDSNGTFWGIQDVAPPRVDTGSIRATQVGAGQSPAYSTTINGYGGIKVWVSTTPAPRFNGQLMRGFGLTFDGVDAFTTTQAVPLGGVEITRAVAIKKDVPAGRAGWGRWLDTFRNTTDAPITVKVAFGGQTGYGASGGNSSALVKTSSGDATVTAGDAWAEVATPLSGTSLVGGPQATVIGTPAPFGGAMTFTGNWLHDTFANPLAYGGHEGNFQAYVNTLTLEPGAAESLLHFVVLGQRVNTASSDAERLKVEATASVLAATPDLTGLTAAEIGSIQNFEGLPSGGSIPRIPAPAPPREVTTSGYDVVEKTIGQMQADMASGLTTSQAITRAYLDRIAAYDRGQFGFNAYEIVASDAIEQARRADEARAAGQRSPVLGIPIAIKNLFDTYDMATTNGSLTFEGFRPKRDAFQVAKLREAGAVIIGKAALEEYATSGNYSNDAWGQVWNAFDPSRSAIASSGGSATAVAANLAAGALGSQTGDSLYGPASAASLVTLRGTDGLESGTGVMPLVWLQDFGGVMTRSVSDLADMLNVVAGTDPEDPATAPADANTPEDWRTALDPDALRGKRIGYIPAAWDDPFGTTNTIAASQEALKYFEQAGATIVEMGAAVGDANTPPAPGPTPPGNINQEGWMQYIDAHPELAEQGFPIRNAVDVACSQRKIAYVRQDPGTCAAEPAPRMTAAEIQARREFRDAFKATARTWLDTAGADDRGVDAVVYPGLLSDVSLNDGGGGKASFGRRDTPGAGPGIPTVVFPAGVNDKGQPINLQLLGRAWDDSALVGMAYAFEQRAHGHVATSFAPPLKVVAETPGTVGGTVPPTLSLTLGAPASFGAFTPGAARDYTASTTASVVSTAGDAALSVSDPGHLTNGPFSLPSPLEVSLSKAAWTRPVSNEPVTIGFKQHVGARDALRTGTYSRTLTFTLSTTAP